MYYFVNRWTICAHVVSFINILRQKALKSRALLLWKVWMYLCAMLKVLILNQKTISVKEAALSSSSWNATQDLWIGALVQPSPQAWPSAPLLREYLLCQVNAVVFCHQNKTISRKSTLLLCLDQFQYLQLKVLRQEFTSLLCTGMWLLQKEQQSACSQRTED